MHSHLPKLARWEAHRESHKGRGASESTSRNQVAIRSGPRWLHVLLDDPLRAQQNQLRDRQSARARGFQISDEFEFCGRFDGEIPGLCVLQYFVNIGGGAAWKIGEVRSIGD